MSKEYLIYNPKYMFMTTRQVTDLIRKKWASYPKKFAAIQERAVPVLLENGHKKVFIRCCGCEGLFVRSEIRAHHLKPVGKLESTSQEHVEAYLGRMFCRKKDIQPLCVECHEKAHTEDYEIEKEIGNV